MDGKSKSRELRVHVKDIGIDSKSSNLVTLGTRSRILPIWIAPAEANAIEIALRGKKFERPLTADLIINVLEATAHKVEKLVVTRIEERTFYGELHLKRGSKRGPVLDCRPSDGIGVALRAKAPIYVNSEVMDAAAVSAKQVEALRQPPKLEARPKEVSGRDPLLDMLTRVQTAKVALTYTTEGERSAEWEEGVLHYRLPLPEKGFRQMLDYLCKQAKLKPEGEDEPVTGTFKLEHKQAFEVTVSAALPKRGLPKAVKVMARRL